MRAGLLGARATAVLVSALLVAAVLSFATATANGSWASPAPRATGEAQVVVTIPGSPIPTPSVPASPSPQPSSGGSGGQGGGAPTTPPTEPTAPPVPGSPTAEARGLRVEPDRIEAGATVVATGTGFTPGEQVQFVLYSDPVVIGSYPAAFDGSIQVEIGTPDDLRLGIHTVEATGWVSERVANDTLLVVSASGTGSTLFPWIVWTIVGSALALALIGVMRGWFAGLVPPLRAPS